MRIRRCKIIKLGDWSIECKIDTNLHVILMRREIFLTKEISFQLAASFDANVGRTAAQKPRASSEPNAVIMS